MRTLEDLGDLEGARVLCRVDFNVPLAGDAVADDTRIRAALPTLRELRERGAALILVSHLGRPSGPDPATSLRPVADRLSALIGVPVALAPGATGARVEAMAAALSPGEVLMLENVRWEPGETKNDPELAAALAGLADAYVDDAFGAAHRAHASTEGAARLLERRAAGRLLQREITTFAEILQSPARPLVAVLGGAKVRDKLGVIKRFLTIADRILIGGAMAFPFLRAQGHGVGDSLCAEEDVELARELLGTPGAGERIMLPVDLVGAERFAADADPVQIDGVDVPEGLMGLDIGSVSTERYAAEITGAGTVFWNGPMGAFELAPFAAGTLAVAEAVAEAPGVTVVGGGDSAAALVQFGLDGQVTHLSTGGGAALELIEGRHLPGVEVLN